MGINYDTQIVLPALWPVHGSCTCICLNAAKSVIVRHNLDMVARLMTGDLTSSGLDMKARKAALLFPGRM